MGYFASQGKYVLDSDPGKRIDVSKEYVEKATAVLNYALLSPDGKLGNSTRNEACLRDMEVSGLVRKLEAAPKSNTLKDMLFLRTVRYYHVNHMIKNCFPKGSFEEELRYNKMIMQLYMRM